MWGFEQFLSTTADVADRQIPYYVQWVRQAGESQSLTSTGILEYGCWQAAG